MPPRKKFKKTREFLSQIPSWEKKYKSSSETMLKYRKKDWLDAKANFSKHDLKIFNEPVMEDWETPYMKDLAQVVTKKGGVILEIGYGMGISAKFIQKHKIKKHIIIEANKQVANEAKKFAKKAKHQTIVITGLWEDVIDKIPDRGVDGILFDSYPLSEKELYQNHFFFFPSAYKKLKTGGVFTYYSDEVKKLGKVHLKKLIKAGFKKENIKSTISRVQPPKNCLYWKANTILAPIIIK